jgi:hypothetical protein
MTDTTEGEQGTTPEAPPEAPPRPDWLPEKFKEGSDLAESYKNLESRLGTAPKEYDFSKSDSWLDSTDSRVLEMAEFARSKHVSPDVMDKILETTTSYLEGHQVNTEKEIEKLGENAKERIDTLTNWIESNFEESTREALDGLLNTAESVKAFEELRTKMIDNMSTVPGGNDTAAENKPSIESVTAEMTENFEKYKTDSKYRAEIEAKLNRAAEGMGHLDKVGF